MTHIRPARVQLYFTITAALTLSGMLGCATLQQDLGFSLGNKGSSPSESEEAASGPEGPAFTLEFRPESGTPARTQVPLSEVQFIQEALVESGAAKRFPRMDIELYRPLQDGRVHRLEVQYNSSKRRVAPAYDYALHPNDRLVLIEDTSTVLDDMLGSLFSPLGVMSR